MSIFKKICIMLLVILLLLPSVACGAVKDDDQGSDSASDSSGSLDSDNENTNNGTGNNGDASNDDLHDNTIEHIEGEGELSKVDLARYTIRIDKNNSYSINAAASLNSSLNEKKLSLKTSVSSLYEIIIGIGAEKETAQALTEISSTNSDFIIKFVGEKIVIAAKSNLALEEACTIFYDTYVKAVSGTILNVKDGTKSFGTINTLATLSLNGKSQYEIITTNASSSVKSKVNALISHIKTMCGISSVTLGSSYSSSKNQILIGASAFSETSKALSKIEKNETIVTKINNKIVVAGKSDDATITAIDNFMKAITKAKSANSVKGSYTMSLENAIVDSFCAALSNIPRYSGATYSTTYPSGAGIQQLYYTSANPNGINNYVSQLESLGYEKTEDNSINGNRFVTCYGKNGLVHIAYRSSNKSLSVILDSLSDSVYKTDEPSYTKVTDTALAVISLDYDTTQEKDGNNYDASGMSYAITLEDGRYVIIDGGYGGKARDHHILYNYLKNNNKRKDGKIVIAAWIFTHDHNDHYAAFVNFSKTYGNKITLQYYLMNCGDKSRYNQTPSGWLPGTNSDGGLPYHCISKYYSTAKKIVPHTGQKITFCNTEFEIISTQESHAPNKMQLVNDSSIIIRMTANGVKTLFLADAEAQTTNLLISMYGTTIKSDIMQAAHHGYSGGSTDLYKKVDPDWSLWPTSQECFNQRTTGGGNGNAQSQNKWLRDNTTCYVGDGNIEVLTFIGGASKIKKTEQAPIFTQG